MNRDGVALLTVLWMLAALGTAAALGLQLEQDGARTAEARVAFLRTRWRAESCLARFRASIDRALEDGRNDAWVSPGALAPPDCAILVTSPEDGPVYLATADAQRLATLPGFTPDVVRFVIDERTSWKRIGGLDEFLSTLPIPLRDQIAAHHADLVGRLVFVAVSWDITVARAGGPAGSWVLRERWVRTGERAFVVRREVS